MTKRYQIAILILLSGLFLSGGNGYPFSDAYFLSHEREVFGEVQEYTIQADEETLIALAQNQSLGYNEITSANPNIDPWFPGSGTAVIIPTSWILPEIPADFRESDAGFILINLAEFRLFFIKRVGNFLTVISFPVGIGRKGFDTPLGTYKILKKLKNPSWIIPRSFRDEYPHLPDVVPPGPDNPIGEHALTLTSQGVLIHESDSPIGLGRKISHGCIRMVSWDMKELFSLVYEGFDVIIVNQPVKIGMRDDIPYLEVHRDESTKDDALLREAKRLLEKAGIKGNEDHRIRTAVKEKRGYPIPLLETEL